MSKTYAHKKGKKIKFKKNRKGSDLIIDSEDLHENGRISQDVRSSLRRRVKIALKNGETEIQERFIV
jgi:hypothetical protein